MKNEREEGKTVLICETDAYVFETESTILSVEENGDGKVCAELDRTVFFPEGGGQKADAGTLGGFAVSDVRRSDGKVIHILDCTTEEFAKAGYAEGMQIAGKVDEELRFERMQMHIAEHLFCGIAFRDYGYDNVGFHLSDVVTFDLSGLLDEHQVARIEEECNRVVWKNLPVRVHFPKPEELDNLKFRSKLELTDGVRLVEIEGYDLCACCAPALHTTGEIGVIKIIDTMPHRGGTRITLLAGKKAYRDYVMLHNEEGEMMKIFSSVRGSSAGFARNFCEKNALMHEENKDLKRQITAILTASLIERIQGYERSEGSGNDREGKDETGSIRENGNEGWNGNTREEGKNAVMIAFYPDIDEVQSREIINECVKQYDGIIGIFRSGDGEGFRYVFGRKAANPERSLKELAAGMRETLGGRGGGSEVMIQGSVTAAKEEIQKFFNEDR